MILQTFRLRAEASSALVMTTTANHSQERFRSMTKQPMRLKNLHEDAPLRNDHGSES